MIKPVCSTCNLDCLYCYYKAKSKELYGNKPGLKMTDTLLEKLTVQYLRAMKQSCAFNWQGGEPLLAGLDFFQAAVNLQKKHALPGQTISNNIQTNGTLLTEEWCRFFRENNFLVGVSVDGPEPYHDRFRLDASGKSSFNAAWAGLELLRRNNVEFNVLVTMNSVTAANGAEIYRFLANRGVRYIQFIPILERNPDGSIAGFSCATGDYAKCLVEVYEAWKKNDVGRISVRFIDDLLHYLFYGRSSTCCNSRKCANAFVMEWNGDLFACDHFVYREWLVGNITAEPLEKLLQSPVLEKFARLKTDLPEECRKCVYLQYCKGGCPKHHVPIGTDLSRVNYFCEAYKAFYAAALPGLKRLAKTARSNNMEREIPVQQNTPRQPGKKPGRNDSCPCGSGRKYKLCCGR
jgi:uncharacterized protein